MSSISDISYWIVIFAVLGIAWFGALEIIRRRGWFSNHATISYNTILWLKTKKVESIDKIAESSPKVHKTGATIGVAICYLLMVAGVVLTVIAVYVTMLSPKLPDKTVAPNNILLIPGVTDFVPLTVEVIIALVALVTIHEVAHGVLARVHNIRIKSAGLIWIFVPVGGFVELDDDELNALPVMKKLQIYAAGITANLITLVLGFLGTVYLISLNTGVAIIKSTPSETAMFFWKAFTGLIGLPIMNAVAPVKETLWITQNTVLWMPMHVEPFFGCWFLLHLSFWTFWISLALVFTNVLPLKVTDGGQIFECTLKYILDKRNLGQYAAKVSNNMTILLLIAVGTIVLIPYAYQFYLSVI